MNDIPFNIGDRVRVLERYRALAPETPLPGRTLHVCAPGKYRERGDVPIDAGDGEIYYVPVEYVESVGG